MAKEKIVQSRTSKIKPSVSDVGKKKKMKFVAPELTQFGELEEVKGQFIGAFSP